MLIQLEYMNNIYKNDFLNYIFYLNQIFVLKIRITFIRITIILLSLPPLFKHVPAAISARFIGDVLDRRQRRRQRRRRRKSTRAWRIEVCKTPDRWRKRIKNCVQKMISVINKLSFYFFVSYDTFQSTKPHFFWQPTCPPRQITAIRRTVNY